MIEIVRAVLAESLEISGFVFSMMLLVEYLNVLSRGTLQKRLSRGGPWNYAGAVFLGTTPGCLGAFTDVTLYVHGLISMGALAGAMIATSGDESFVMIALFPGKALFLFGILFIYGVAVGVLVDKVFGRKTFGKAACDTGLAVHPEVSEKIHWRGWSYFRLDCSLQRASLCVGLGLFLLAVIFGALGPSSWDWIRWSLVAVTVCALWIVSTVPDHFLEEHLFKHVVKEHLPRIFLWVLGVLLFMALIQSYGFPLAAVVKAHPAWALLAAALVGVIPESGPHLIFVTLFAQGALPFSVLVTSSVVQDGHGMLPLLAESRMEFLKVKAINLVAGLALGYALLSFGL